jgi:hypothetical protein
MRRITERRIRQIKRSPFFPFVPIVPIAIFFSALGSLAASFRALVRVRRLERRVTAPVG